MPEDSRSIEEISKSLEAKGLLKFHLGSSYIPVTGVVRRRKGRSD